MTKQEKVSFVINTLQNLYPEIPIPLDHKDPYTLLIAVLLSAQCTDVRVNQITPLLFAKADNPFDMVKMTIEEIKEIIRPCGLSPMKSNGIYGLSKILIEKYKGEVPQSFEALEALPAVGHKTTSVVMSQAFNGESHDRRASPTSRPRPPLQQCRHPHDPISREKRLQDHDLLIQILLNKPNRQNH